MGDLFHAFGARARTVREDGVQVTAGGPEPGWLPDPWNAGRERYWDGSHWTSSCRASSSQTSVPKQQPPSSVRPGPQLAPIPAVSEVPVSAPPPPPSVADDDAKGGQAPVTRFWAQLPAAGRFAVVAAPLVAILIALLVVGFSSRDSSSGVIGSAARKGQAHAGASFSGTKGDRDLQAYSADVGVQTSDPAGDAQFFCQLRTNGFSERQVIEMSVTGLHGERERNLTDVDVLRVVAAEYHFCPQYFGDTDHSTAMPSIPSTTAPTTVIQDPTTRATPAPTHAPSASEDQWAPTNRAILNAKVGDCLQRIRGKSKSDGTREVFVYPANCSNSLATDRVVNTWYGNETPACPNWVRSAGNPPKVLCLQSLR